MRRFLSCEDFWAPFLRAFRGLKPGAGLVATTKAGGFVKLHALLLVESVIPYRLARRIGALTFASASAERFRQVRPDVGVV